MFLVKKGLSFSGEVSTSTSERTDSSVKVAKGSRKKRNIVKAARGQRKQHKPKNPTSNAKRSSKQRSDANSKKKSSYKHVPHSEKPAHVVEKRNARERRRVHAVNLAYVKLRKAIPFENNVRKLYACDDE